jgi:hypothetical protein
VTFQVEEGSFPRGDIKTSSPHVTIIICREERITYSIQVRKSWENILFSFSDNVYLTSLSRDTLMNLIKFLIELC